MSQTREHLKAFLYYLVLVIVMYGPVVFSGRSLSPALVQPNGLVDGRPYGYSGRVPVNTFNVDLATPAYYEFPLNRAIGEMYKRGELPLWNPFQGAGTPLAADYSTRAFFPYQVLQDMSPPLLWDFFLLGRVLIAGFFTYLFLSRLHASFAAAFTGGVLYMFSGLFTWFLNLEQFSNVSMMAPVLLYTVELLAAKRSRRHIGYSGLSAGLTVLAGQPEAALYSLLLAASYFVLRSMSLGDFRAFSIALLKGAAALLLGLMLSSVLVLPFLKNVEASYTVHPAGSGIGAQYVNNWKKAFSILTPSATEVPAHPTLLPGVLEGLRDSHGEDFHYRVLATKGAWDYLGGYSGTTSVFLLMAGVFLSLSGGFRQRKLLIFFTLFGVSVILKNFGVKPFLWLGDLPFFDRAWSPRWAGTSWVFSISVAGALGLQAFSEGGSARKKYLAALASFIALLFFFLLFPLPAVSEVVLTRESLFSPEVSGFIVPSIALGNAVSVISLISALIILLYCARSGEGLYAVIFLVFLELWWNVPRGYGSDFLYLKLIPFSLGLAGVFLSLKGRLYIVPAGLLFLASFLLIDSLSPRGLPTRHDPFAGPPYLEFLREKGEEGQGFRVMGAYGVLMPNYAGSTGLQDLHYINALANPGFIGFRKNNLEIPVEGEEREGTLLWFTGLPKRLVVGFDRSRGVYYKTVNMGPEKEIAERLPWYSLMGVRYFLLPPWFRGDPGKLPLVYDGEIKIYENPEALPRAFVTYSFAFKEDSVILQKPSELAAKEAVIREYGANTVVIEAELERPGLLVLTDVFAPGWKAYLSDGSAPVIHPVNGFLRGVALGSGRHTVTLRYVPEGFIGGLILSASGALVVLILMVPGSGKKREA